MFEAISFMTTKKSQIKNVVARAFILRYGIDAKYSKKEAEYLVNELMEVFDTLATEVREETLKEIKEKLPRITTLLSPTPKYPHSEIWLSKSEFYDILEQLQSQEEI